MIKFLIITQPRSGSAWFMSCLNSHPQIYCPAQTTLFSKHNLSPIKWFKPDFLQVDNPISPYFKYRSGSFKKKIARWFNPKKLVYDFLNHMYTENQNAEAIGFKVNYSQIRKNRVILSWVKQNDVKIIQLVRHNLLKRLVSHKIANARNLFHTIQSVEPIKVHIDPKVLKEDFSRREKRFAMYRKRFVNVPYLEVSYESLTAGFDTEIRKVLTFLGVDERKPLTSKLVKVNPDSLKDMIKNYTEIKKALVNTQFEKYLN